jgi:hypothetical protein
MKQIDRNIESSAPAVNWIIAGGIRRIYEIRDALGFTEPRLSSPPVALEGSHMVTIRLESRPFLFAFSVFTVATAGGPNVVVGLGTFSLDRGFFRLAPRFCSAAPRPRCPGGPLRPFHSSRDYLPFGLSGSFGDEIADAFEQSSRALISENAALDRCLRQRPENWGGQW